MTVGFGKRIMMTDYFSSALTSSDSPFFLFFFLLSLSFFESTSFSSASSSSFSVLSFSGLYQTGGCEMRDGPAGSSAIVKWNAATYVFAGVYLTA